MPLSEDRWGKVESKLRKDEDINPKEGRRRRQQNDNKAIAARPLSAKKAVKIPSISASAALLLPPAPLEF